MKTTNLFLFFYFISASCGADQHTDVEVDFQRNIASVIFIDAGVQDSALSYSAILETIDPQAETTDTCSQVLGVLSSDVHPDSLNEVYRSIYGCQRTFFLRKINMHESIRQAGHSYFKIDFWAIQGYYSIPMMKRLHKEFLENNLRVVLSANFGEHLVKSDSFEIKGYSYGFESNIEYYD